MQNSEFSVILPSQQNFVDELHENPISVAIIVLDRVGALLRLELLGVVMTDSCVAFRKNFLFLLIK